MLLVYHSKCLTLRNKPVTGNISLYAQEYAQTEEELEYFNKRQTRLRRLGIDVDVSK